ncbi:hypothetical protein ACVHIE_001424, partial [Yersinia enterocolitica]
RRRKYVLVGSSRAFPGADALLFYLPSPCKIELSKFVSSLTPLRPFFCLDLALITQGVDE